MSMARPDASNLVELLALRAAEQPSGRAYTWLPDGDETEVSLSYAQLETRARAIAVLLSDACRPGDRALLLYPPGLEYIAAYFGCLCAGVVAVPAYPPRPGKPAPRLEAIVADARATLALTTESILAKLQPRIDESPSLRGLRWRTTDALDESAASSWQQVPVDSRTVAFLQYTSGTTGAPRGVMVTHGNLLSNSALIAEGFERADDDRGVFWLPIYHDMGLIGGVLQPLWMGRPTTLMPPAAFLQSPFRWLAAISRLKANISGGPDMAYELCTRQISDEQKAKLDLSHWELAFSGAEPVRPRTIDRFVRAFEQCGFRREAFYPCFGLAENALIVAGGRRAALPVVRRFRRSSLERGQAVVAGSDDSDALVRVGHGRALGEQELCIVDPATGHECPPGGVGEIWLMGACVAAGYFGDEAGTARQFRAYLPDGRGPFLRSRDLGVLVDGELYFAGRMADVVELDGRMLFPQDLEETAEGAHAALRPGFGAAFHVEVEGARRLVIAYELERRAKADMEAIGPAVHQAVRARHEVDADTIVMVRMLSLPKTTSGKIQRFAARDGFLDGSLETVARWQRL